MGSDIASPMPPMFENLFIGQAPVGDFKGYLDELMVLDGLISSGEVTVRWSHVRGHSGLEGNEAADELARAGARRDTRA